MYYNLFPRKIPRVYWCMKYALEVHIMKRKIVPICVHKWLRYFAVPNEKKNWNVGLMLEGFQFVSKSVSDVNKSYMILQINKKYIHLNHVFIVLLKSTFGLSISCISIRIIKYHFIDLKIKSLYCDCNAILRRFWSILHYDRINHVVKPITYLTRLSLPCIKNSWDGLQV